MKPRVVVGSLIAVLTLSTAFVGGCGGGDSGGSTLIAPTELKAVILAGPAVHLTWKDTPNEHHYSIERKDGAGAFKEIDTNDPNEAVYHDANVMTGSYSYRIAGAAASGEKSPYSAEVTATVP